MPPEPAGDTRRGHRQHGEDAEQPYDHFGSPSSWPMVCRSWLPVFIPITPGACGAGGGTDLGMPAKGAFWEPRTPIGLFGGSAQYAERLTGAGSTWLALRCFVPSYPLVQGGGSKKFSMMPRWPVPSGAVLGVNAEMTG